MRVFLVVALSACYFDKPGPPAPALDGALEDGAAATANYVFVTSTKIAPGAIGGPTAGDQLCQGLADAAHLDGTFTAWLSSGTSNAGDRLRATNPRGWIRPDGKPFCDTIDDLVHNRVYYPPRVTERNEDLVDLGADAELEVATGTGADGLDTNGTDCAGFTATAAGSVTSGHADAGPYRWVAAHTTLTCATPMRIYCLGTDRRVAVSVVAESSRLAFLGANDYYGDTTRPQLDVACQRDATMAGLPGTFLAALPTGAQAAQLRFPAGAPWVRRDGVTAIASDMRKLEAPLTIRADGIAEVDLSVWTGVKQFADKPPAAAICNDWMTQAGATVIGDPNRSDASALDVASQTCGFGRRVYCLQQ